MTPDKTSLSVDEEAESINASSVQAFREAGCECHYGEWLPSCPLHGTKKMTPDKNRSCR